MEEADKALQKGYITLKEAAEISKYSPDYIGQLIRAGKLEGKQVYNNVAWVTTEKALRDYIIGRRKSERESNTEIKTIASAVPKVLRYGAYIGIVLSVCLSLVLFYILSVGIDRSIAAKANNVEVSEIYSIFEGI